MTAEASGRATLVNQALRLEALTIGWMVIEAAVAIAAAVAANSLLLLAFGLDSAIELMSAGVLAWRLTAELRQGTAFSETAERRAGRIAGGLLFALALYVVAGAAWALWQRAGAAFSAPGLALTLGAIPLMLWLARRKRALAAALGSGALKADAAEAIACAWLSGMVVIGLLAQLAFGVWWIDPVASLAIVYFLATEGREAWSGQDCCDG